MMTGTASVDGSSAKRPQERESIHSKHELSVMTEIRSA